MIDISKDNSVTGIIIAKNEEVCISRAVQSLSWCQQVFVIDTGSADNTINVAAQSGASVLNYVVRPFNFADVRNFSLNEIEIDTQWVMFLDADEICTPDLARVVDATVQKCPEDVGVFRIAGKYLFLGRWMKHSMRFPAWHDRLIRIGAGHFKGTDEGGYLEKFVCNDGYTVDYITETYVHDAFVHGIDSWLEKHIERARYLADEIDNFINAKSGFGQIALNVRYSDGVKVRARIYSLGLGYLAPFLQFFYMYIYRMGFLDGRQGLLLSAMFSIFEAMIYVMVTKRNISRSDQRSGGQR